jgi:hypothetical protein
MSSSATLMSYLLLSPSLPPSFLPSHAERSYVENESEFLIRRRRRRRLLGHRPVGYLEGDFSIGGREIKLPDAR